MAAWEAAQCAWARQAAVWPHRSQAGASWPREAARQALALGDAGGWWVAGHATAEDGQGEQAAHGASAWGAVVAPIHGGPGLAARTPHAPDLPAASPLAPQGRAPGVGGQQGVRAASAVSLPRDTPGSARAQDAEHGAAPAESGRRPRDGDGADASLPRGVRSASCVRPLRVHWQGVWEAGRTAPREGERWLFWAEARPPHAEANPGLWQQELWLLAQGTRTQFRVRSAMLLANAGQPSASWREQAIARLRQTVPDGSAQGLLLALSLGLQQAVGPSDWQSLSALGLSHAVVISGLHIQVWAWISAAACSGLWRRSSRACAWCPAPLAGAWAGAACACAYAWLSGWGLPAQRTVLMMALLVISQTGARAWSPAQRWLGTVALLLFSQPWALMDVGFQLSAGCVALLMLAGSWPADEFAMGQEDEPHAVVSAGPARSLAAQVGRGCRAMAMRGSRVLRDAVRAHVQAQWVALWGLTPWVLGCLGSWGWASWWVNLVCLPVLTLVTTPLALLGLFHPPAWAWAAMSLRPLSAWLEAYQPTPQAWWMPAGLSGVHVALAVIAGMAVLWRWPWPCRLSGAILWCWCLWPAATRVPEGHFTLDVLDVGQGTAVLVRTRRHALLYDAGPASTDEARAWRAQQRLSLPAADGGARSPGQPVERPAFRDEPLDRVVSSEARTASWWPWQALAGAQQGAGAGPMGGPPAPRLDGLGLPPVDALARPPGVGERLIVPSLRRAGAWPPQLLVLSHADADHVGGAAALAQARVPLLHGIEPGHPLPRLFDQAARCRAGQSWTWDGVRFEVMHPGSAQADRRDGLAAAGHELPPELRANELSCVLRIWPADDGAGAGALLTGDIESQAEAALADAHEAGRLSLASAVLLAPHHGSKTSSTPRFLAAVSPSWVVAQAGAYSRYRHPNAQVWARYLSLASVQEGGAVQTPWCGAWHWQSIRPAQSRCHRTEAAHWALQGRVPSP
ncbi:MAG: hypothetical protein E6Q92_12055 [Burkholderiaceae bacterium]|nr:MAG: hypothetical protein E6Q92_12055 [Burkholderiaceae bacterium]